MSRLRLIGAAAIAVVAVVAVLLVDGGEDQPADRGGNAAQPGEPPPRKICRRAGVTLTLRSVTCAQAAVVYRPRTGDLPGAWRCAPRACARFDGSGREHSFFWTEL